MFDKPQASHVFGLEIDAFSFKGVALSGKNPRVQKSFDYILPHDSNVKPLYTTQEKQDLERLLEKYLVVTFLNTQDVLVRPLDLKLKKEKDIDSVLAFQTEPLLPYPIENALVDKIIVFKDKEVTKLSILAARKDHVTAHLKEWNQLGIEPEIISTAPFALSLFANQFAYSEEACYVLHIGLAHSLCIVTEKGKLLAAQNISQGLESILEAYVKDTNQELTEIQKQFSNRELDLNQIQQQSSVKTQFEEIRLSITRTVYAVGKQIKNKEINNLLITGPGATLESLVDILAKSLNKNLLTLSEDLSFGMTAYELKQFTLPIGAALSALSNSKDQLNFRQQEFVYPKPWKRLKQPLVLYFSLCLGLACALYLLGQTYTHYQEGKIKEQYLELLTVMNRPYVQFEKEFSLKNSSGSTPSETESLTIDRLDSQGLEKRLTYLEKEIQSTPQSYPLLPNVPLVSDVLAWLSTHPNFVGKGSTEPSSTSLQIETFNYALVKRPEPTKKQEKYQVKVELEFSSPTPKMAREFHDALITPNELVDPKAEIKWSSNRDRYRTSFYLKDKTVYPSP